MLFTLFQEHILGHAHLEFHQYLLLLWAEVLLVTDHGQELMVVLVVA
jgi:hypothetical protein